MKAILEYLRSYLHRGKYLGVGLKAEAVPPAQTVYKSGDTINVNYDAVNVDYEVVTTF